ncbi:helix-turn-helix domain-containing protein [Corynebacterium glyciniphilum]|uniref:helix-turn-helix domain-containing protein n=1 Tax=Corynebacterium glyciniphilum TaxID=1404244 RepID=UPI0011AB67E9|nr:helix-turn-helix transcriptional regulator [Corynebacterium glyciniphilum]
MNYAQKIGEHLAWHRKQRGLSQSSVARKAGVSASAISGWEDDASTIRFDTLVAWARALNVNIGDLISKLDRGLDLIPAPPVLEYRGHRYLRAGDPVLVSHSPAKRVEEAEVTHETP